MALTLKKNVLFWDSLLFLLIGLTISMAILSGGPLVAFGFLLIPPLIPHLFARTIRQFFVGSSVIGVVNAFIGFCIAYRYDLPVGPADVALLGMIYCLAFCVRRVAGLIERKPTTSSRPADRISLVIGLLLVSSPRGAAAVSAATQDETVHIERVAAATNQTDDLTSRVTGQASDGPALPTLARICTPENVKGWKSVSGFCHLLLYYGRGPMDLVSFPSGDLLVKALTEEQTAIETFGKSPFTVTQNGLRYFLFDDPVFHTDIGEAHRDQCLATFAGLDLPLATGIHLKSRAYSIADLLSESVASFSFDQMEIAWSAMAYARYLPPQTEWTNHLGERVTFSKLVHKLLQTDLNGQKCAGVHIFEALILIERADRHHSILDDKTRQQLGSYLTTTVHEIVQRQQGDGSWSKRWCAALNDNPEPMSPFQMSFLATGHLAETLNLLDGQRRPPQSVYVRAAKWLQESMNSPEIQPNGFWVCPFTHAALGAREILKR
jgi:hypothetical protein